MKTILLPTDFSQNSINAIHFALNYFKHLVCDFYIINVQRTSTFVTDDMMAVPYSSSIYSTIVDASKKSIENVILLMESTYANKNHKFHSIVDYDNFIDAIDQASKRYNVDVIVMGTKGASGINKFIFGSNTVRVMQRLEVPVLAIPEGCEFSKLDKVALITNNIRKEDINKLNPLKNLLTGHISKLTGITLNSEPSNLKFKPNYEFLEALFKQVEYKNIDVSQEDLFNVTEAYLKTNNFQMLALLNEKHSFFERLLHTHHIETFGFSINIPFFVMDS